jgi:multisubunit Na+/H+ antiporter MnhG subunit
VSSAQHDSEGNSVAAWTAVIIMLVAFAIGTVAFWFVVPWLVIASAVLLVIGPLVGWYLGRAGYGVNGPKRVPRARS